MGTSTRHRRRRLVICSIVLLAVAGGVAAAIVVHKPTAKAATAAPSIFKTETFKTATVKRGDLTTTESVDGSVQLSATLTVLHRIEGQTSSSTSANSTNTATTNSSNSTTATSSPSNNSSNSSNSSTPLPVNSAALIDCSATTATQPTTTTTTTPAAPASTTTPNTTATTATPGDVPADSAPTTSTAPTTPTITTTPDSTTTTAAPTPAQPPSQPCDTSTTTTPADTAPSTTPDTTAVAGRGGGGGSSPTGASRSASNASAGSSVGGGASTARITQTITSIIGANTAIQHGDVLYTVDGSPVVALDGALPAWRSMSTSSTDGVDIAQLETSLVTLGYDPGQKVTIDDHFDSATRTMVKAWQAGLGVETTGTVTLGSVVFLPAATTVSGVARAVGDAVGDGDTVLTLATPTQEVLIDVPTGDEAQVVPGLGVKIGQVEGAITRLRSANRNGSVVVEAIITPAAPITDAGNGSSVKVSLTLQNNSGALIAPAEALVSRLDGTYAVETQSADGSTQWLTVELLGVSGGNVAISGDGVSEGTTLLLPV